MGWKAQKVVYYRGKGNPTFACHEAEPRDRKDAYMVRTRDVVGYSKTQPPPPPTWRTGQGRRPQGFARGGSPQEPFGTALPTSPVIGITCPSGGDRDAFTWTSPQPPHATPPPRPFSREATAPPRPPWAGSPHAPALHAGKPGLPPVGAGWGTRFQRRYRASGDTRPRSPLPPPTNPQFWEIGDLPAPPPPPPVSRQRPRAGPPGRSPAQLRPCERTKRQQRSHHVPAAAAGPKRCGGSGSGAAAAAASKMVRTWRGRGGAGRRRPPPPYAGPGTPVKASGCGKTVRRTARPRGGFPRPSAGAAAMRSGVRRPLAASPRRAAGAGGRLTHMTPAGEGAGGGGGGGGGERAPNRTRVLPPTWPPPPGWAGLGVAAAASLPESSWRWNGGRAAGGGSGTLPAPLPWLAAAERSRCEERFFLPFSRHSLITCIKTEDAKRFQEVRFPTADKTIKTQWYTALWRLWFVATLVCFFFFVCFFPSWSFLLEGLREPLRQVRAGSSAGPAGRGALRRAQERPRPRRWLPRAQLAFL